MKSCRHDATTRYAASRVVAVSGRRGSGVNISRDVSLRRRRAWLKDVSVGLWCICSSVIRPTAEARVASPRWPGPGEREAPGQRLRPQTSRGDVMRCNAAARSERERGGRLSFNVVLSALGPRGEAAAGLRVGGCILLVPGTQRYGRNTCRAPH